MKIGIYTDDEILEFMTEGEGRGFLGRSMFDAMYFEIERLNNIINEFNKLIENEINESKLEEDYDRVDAMEYCLATLRELKGSDNNE